MTTNTPEHLTACFRAITSIGASLDLDAVIERTMAAAENLMNAEAASILLLDEATGELYFRRATGIRGREVETIRIPPGQGFAGWVVREGKPLLVAEAEKDPRHFRDVDNRAAFRTRNLIAVPLQIQGRTIGVAEVLNRREGTFHDPDVALFEAFATLVAISIENARLYRRQMEAAETERALGIAREIQTRLQGPESIVLPFAEAAGFSAPAISIGGDFFDSHYDGENLYLTVGDVSGKGIPAALLMADCLGRVRSDMERMMEPGDLLTHLNRSWFRRAQGGRFLTVVVVRITPEGRLTYAQAGHPAPIVFGEGKAEALPDIGSVPIGVIEGAIYRTGTRELVPGERVLVATDGITEAGEGTEIGALGAAALLAELRAAPRDERPAGTVERLVRLVERREGEEAHDDRTLVVGAYRPAPSIFRFERTKFGPDDLAALRSETRAFLDAVGLPRRVGAKNSDRIVLGLDEASANVIRHAYEGKEGPFRLELRLEGKEITAVLEDEGCGRIPEAVAPGDRGGRVGGFGLHILHEVMDEVRYDRTDAPCGVRLTMVKRIEKREVTR